jgi:hypothetical protein
MADRAKEIFKRISNTDLLNFIFLNRFNIMMSKIIY